MSQVRGLAILRSIFVACLANLAMGVLYCQSAPDVLKLGFENPPNVARPRVWWHWMNGNISKEGITADLQWMKRVGIGGFDVIDANLGVPQFVDRRVVWMTPEWKDALRHAAAEADRLGLEMQMDSSPGWSETGGPWVKPQEAMKKVVWSETKVQGPRRFEGVLPPPPSVNGLFQNIPRPAPLTIPVDENLPGAIPSKAVAQPTFPPYYADSKVIAFRMPVAEVSVRELQPKVTSSAGKMDIGPLFDGDLSTAASVGLPGDGSPAWIQLEFAKPFRARSFTFAGKGGGEFGPSPIPAGKFEASEDGKSWSTIVVLPGPGHTMANFPVLTYAFPEVSARFFRVQMRPSDLGPLATVFHLTQPTSVDVAEIAITSTPQVNRWEEKAGFGHIFENDTVATPPVSNDEAISSVLDLTSNMNPDGTLSWDVPAGNWMILRMGYSLTGQPNSSAIPEATGYEVDKLSREYVENYWNSYVGQVSDAIGPYFGKSFRYFLMDSWEVSLGNWTPTIVAEFQKRRGYDPSPYLPVLTGRVVGSAERSDRFLWDFRRTLADLVTDYHYHAAAELLEKRGIGLYGQAPGTGDPTIADGLQSKGRIAIPMGEFWMTAPGQKDRADHDTDVREAASAAHIYGKQIVAGESFTTSPEFPLWAQSPFMLKRLADKAFAGGINQISIHESAHQPFTDAAHKPGMTLGPIGQNFTRNITWAEQAGPWIDYLSRASYMLQQGKTVADIAYFVGEGAPATVPFWKEVVPAPPAGYYHDWLNTEVLLTASARDGRILLPSGASYRLLVLPSDVDRLTLLVLRKLRELVAAGAILVAPRPIGSPSLADYPASETQVPAIVNEVWGSIDGKSISENSYGKGKVFWGRPLLDVLTEIESVPDVEFNRPNLDSELVWHHRRAGDTDIYFVANQRNREEEFSISFRTDGKAPEFWHADSGLAEPAEFHSDAGRTIVPVRLDPYGSTFVVFRPASSVSRRLPVETRQMLHKVEGNWQLKFPADSGAPAQVSIDKLSSWTDSADLGIKYFSGTATYLKTIEVPNAWFKPGTSLFLDLGSVKEIAEVLVNGKNLGVFWKAPYRVDVTSALKPGVNNIEIRVTNLWPNRVIGDLQPDAKKSYTFTDFRAFSPDSPLLKSGLLGPVTVLRSSKGARTITPPRLQAADEFLRPVHIEGSVH